MSEIEEYQDDAEESEDLYDDQKELQENQLEQFEEFPRAKQQENILTWFWKIVRLKDSTKVANLDSEELGKPNMSVRDLQKIGLVASQLGKEEIANFFLNEAEIILGTSMAKKGWLVEQSISQKKYSTRTKGRLSNAQISKWKMFQRKTPDNSNQ